MASAAKLRIARCPAIEPELKQFLDECLIPMLVRDALRDLAAEKQVAPSIHAVASLPRSDHE
jgi:hypothetical protein